MGFSAQDRARDQNSNSSVWVERHIFPHTQKKSGATQIIHAEPSRVSSVYSSMPGAFSQRIVDSRTNKFNVGR